MTRHSSASRLKVHFASDSASPSTRIGRRWRALPQAARRGLGMSRDALRLVAAVILLGAFGVTAQAQYSLAPSWYQQSPANSPSQRDIHALAYDAAHRQVVLFGGIGSGYMNDTWLWDGTNWTQANPATSPSGRAAAAMAYDSTHGQIVLFGGISSASNRLGDTWLWNGTNWTQAAPSASPSPRDGAVLVDTGNGLLLFGGTNGTYLNDTWLWNGTNWVQQSPASSPSARADYGMVYDTALGEAVLFGGNSNTGYLSDTWLYNGQTWTLLSTGNTPPARYAQGMVYDAALGQVIMFGGYNGSTLADTWEFAQGNSGQWVQLTTPSSPSARYVPNGMAYDSGHNQVLLFGGLGSTGLSDTWEFGLPGNFGNVNVCPSGQTTPAPCSKTISFLVDISTLQNLGTPQVLTQGASGLDFTLASGSTCIGVGSTGSCIVNATFTPTAPGLRTGAVQLLAPGNVGVVLNIPVYGVGQGPAVAFSPAPQGILNTGTYSFNQPKGLTTDAAGNLYVADTGVHNDGNRNVVKIAPNGTQTDLGTGLLFPQGLAVDGAGDLFVADNDLNEVIEIPAGCTSSSCQQVLPTPQCVVNTSGLCAQLGVAVDGPGNVFIASFNSEVLEIAANGGAQTVVYNPVGSKPVGIAVDSAGDLFIADYGLTRVVEVPVGCTSASCQILVGSGWSQPDDVAVDAAGDVFVADAGLQEVVEVPAGCVSASCQIVQASGIETGALTVNAAGDVYADNLATNQIVAIKRSQPPSAGFPSTSVGLTSGPLSFTFEDIGNQPLNAESPGLITVNGPNFVNVPGTGTPADCSASSTLTPGQVCNLSISFAPQTAGPLSGTAVFTDNALNAASATQTIALSGTASGSSYSVGGAVSGLNGGTVVLQNNLGNNLAVASNGPFSFPSVLPSGSPYSVTVLTQPAGQACTVTNGSGTVGSADVTNVQVTCANLVTYPLTVTTFGTGTGTVTDNLGEIACSGANGATLGLCTGPYPTGTLVTLTAAASGSSVFVGWGGACSSSGASATCLVTMNSALSVSASFVAPPAAQSTLLPITAGVVYGQGGSLISNAAANGGGGLSSPNGAATDSSGNLYVADGGNNRVLFYPAGSTTPTRVYGQGGSFTSNTANNGGVSANSLNNPEGIALDSNGNLYVADAYNNRVLFYAAGSTTATRVYGQGGSFSSAAVNNGGVSADSLQTPAGVAVDSGGNLYIADQYNNRVLFYPAGSTTATRVYGQGGSFSSYGGNNGGVSASSLSGPAAVSLDSSGDLYVADQFNNRVLFYPANSTTASQVYGQGGSFASAAFNNGGVSAGSLSNPAALAVDSGGGLYVADGNSRVLFYPFASTTATRVYGQAGSFTSSGFIPGSVSANSLAQPAGVALDNSGNVFIADNGNNRVLEYGSFGSVNACPANQSTPAPCSSTVTFSYAPAAATTIGAARVVTQGITGLDYTYANGGTCGGAISVGNSCTINVTFTPLAPGLRSGAVELFDNNGNVAATAPAYGIGQGPVIAYGPGTQTTVGSGLANPFGVAVDAAGDVFIGDYGNQRVVEVQAGGNQITIASGLNYPEGVAVDGAGNVFIADSDNNRVLEVPAGGGPQTTVGSGLNNPTGVAVDGAGNVFIADYRNSRVVKVPAGGGPQTTVSSGLNVPQAVAVDGLGDVFIADSGNNRVVKVAPSGVQTTVTASGLSDPIAVAVDAAGDVFIGNYNNTNVVEVTPTGVQTLVPVTGLGGGVLGVVVDPAGDLFLSDFTNSVVRKMNRSQIPALAFATTDAGMTSSDSPKTVTLQNVGNQPLTGSLAFNLGSSFTQNTSLDCSTAFPLAPGASCTDSYTFSPQSAAFLSGTAVYTDNNLNGAPAIQTVTLSGTGASNGVAGLATVPNVVGQAQSAAPAPITSAGLALGTVSTASSQTVLPGVVISQSPAAGTQVAVGSAVNLLVSTGLPQPAAPDPLSINNNYFITGDYVAAGVTLRGTGVNGTATGTITIPKYTQSTTLGVPDGADIIDAFLYWETLENTSFASSTIGTFNGYQIVGQQIGNDLPNYVDGQFTGTIRSYRANVNIYLPVGANGVRFASGTYTVSLPDGGTALPLTEGASLVLVYRVLSPNFPLKSVVIYDGSAAPTAATVQPVLGFYDAVGGASGTGKNTNIFASGGVWNSTASSVTLGQSNQFNAPLNAGAAYAAVIVSTPVNNSDNDGILDAWKAGPPAGDFHAGQPGYYDVKTATWVGLPGAAHGQKDLFVQLDYMCGAVLASGSCDPTQENLFPSPDVNGNDPLAMVQKAFANSGVVLHLQVGNAVPETTCTDGNASQLCQFPGQPGVVGWKNSLEFSKLYPRNLAACLAGGDCTTRFPFGQKDSYHYVLMGHSLAIPAWNTRYGTLTSISVVNGVTTIGTVDRGAGINACPSRVTISGVLGNPALNGVYNTTGCADTKTITLATPGVQNYTYPNNILPEPVIGLTSGTVSSISGYSDLGGSDSAVTLGLWLTAPNQDMSKKANVVAGTIFHEIGHTLGLSHGGLYYDTPNSYVPTFEANCKPNYQSVMNYLFQLDGVGPNNAVAFSNQTLATLNESTAASVTQLTDGQGNAATFPTSAWYVPYTAGLPVSPATRHCDGTPLIGDSAYRVDASIAPITPPWSNGQDLDFIGTLQTEERGYNDLAALDLRQVGATGGEFASLASVLSFGSSVAPLNIGANGNVTLGSGGTIALGSGGNVTLGSGGNVTLGSGGTITLGSGGNVTLGSGGNVTLGSGGTITPGSSGTVTLGSGGNVTLGSGGTITLGSGGTVVLGSGGNVTLGSGGTIALGSGGTVTIPSSGGSYTIPSGGGTITLGSGGNVTLGSGGNVTLGSGGTIALGSGGTITLGSGGNVTLGSGGTITLGSGGTIALGSGGNVTLGSGGTITLGSGGTVTLGSGGNVTLGSGGTVTLGSGGNVALGSGGNVTLGSGGTATLGAGGTVTLGSGGNVTLGSGGNVTLGSGGTIALGSGGNVTLGSGGNVTLGSGGTITLGSGGNVTLGSGGTITLGSGGVPQMVGAGTYTLGAGGTVTLGSGGNVTLGSGGNITLGSGGTITLGSGGNVTLGSGGNVTLGSGGTITLGSGGTITLGSGGNVTLGSGGVVTLGNGGSVSLGSGSDIALGTVNNITPASGGPSAANELTYETANSVVRPPASPTETMTSPTSVRITWTAPAFGVVKTYTIYRSSNGATPIVIGSVSGVNGNPPATEFTDTNPDLTSNTVVYTVTTTLVPDSAGPSRQSVFSPPAVLKNDQSITLGPLPSSVLITNPPTVTATATSGGAPNGLQVVFSATGPCAIGSQTIANNVSSATVSLTGTGSCTVTAAQPGTTAFNAANSVSGTFQILPKNSSTQSQTITFPALPNAQYGSSFSFSASSTSGLPVTFAASGPCTTAGVINGVGVCSITASAPANGTYSAASLTQSFNIYPAVLTVTANSLTSTAGQPLPALTYNYGTFVHGDTSAVISGAPSLSTTATATSAPGSYPITVSTGTLATPNYSFLYVTGTLTIQPANQAALILNAASPLTYGQSETLSVSGGSTGGTVTYNLVSGPCTLNGAMLTAASGTGTCQVTATMAGNSIYNPVTSSPANITLATAGQTISFTTNPPASAPYNSTFTVAATGGASTNPVTFTSAGSCSNTGTTYKITSGTGTCSVIANQAGNSNYSAASTVTKSVSATLASQTITFTTSPPASAAYTSTFTVAATGGASTNPVTFTSAGSCSNTAATYKITSGTGSCSVIASQAGNSNYAAATLTKTVTAVPATPVITWPAPAAIIVGYPLTATQLDATASLAGTPVAGTFVYTPKLGTVLGVGANQMLSVVFTPADAVDYAPAAASVPITVNPATVTLGVSSTTQTYQQWTNFVIAPIYTGSRVPTGTVTLYDNGVALTTLTLGGDGKAYYTASPFNVGANVLSATYSGNSYFPPGASSPVTITVLPAPVNFQASCWGAQVYGVQYQCAVNVSASTSIQPGGVITYSFDGGTPVSVPIVYGNAPFTVPGLPNAGNHTLVLSYAAQGNFAAAGPLTEKFTTLQGQTLLLAYPSNYNPAAGSSITISGAVSTPVSGYPSGSVTVYDGSTAIGTATIGSTGAISYTVTSIAKGTHNYSVSYAGSLNYTAASSSVSTVTAK